MKVCGIYYFYLALRRRRQREGVEGAIGLEHIQIFIGCGKFASQDSTRKCEIFRGSYLLPRGLVHLVRGVAAIHYGPCAVCEVAKR